MINLSIVTPGGLKFNDKVSKVTVPSVNGYLEAHPGHVPLMACSKPGIVTINIEGKETYIVVDKGFIEIDSDNINVLVERSKFIEELNLEELEEKLKNLKEEIKGKNTYESEYLLKERQQKYLESLIEAHSKK